MRQRWSEKLKQALRPVLYRAIYSNREPFHCPICQYRGPFKDKRISKLPDVVRVDSKCPGCSATERHRMMSLVLQDTFSNWDAHNKSLLHVAPEECLKPQLAKFFGTYHTTDLFAKDVDFQEDLQDLSFADASYDAILVSRVLTIPPDLDACLRQMARVLKPGGIAVLAETYIHDATVEFGEMRNGRSREIGVDLLAKLAEHFGRVEQIASDGYPAEYQLNNRMMHGGQPRDDYPELVRLPGVGFKDLVVLGYR